jgi:hypothetical protein
VAAEVSAALRNKSRRFMLYPGNANGPPKRAAGRRVSASIKTLT